MGDYELQNFKKSKTRVMERSVTVVIERVKKNKK